MKKSTILSTLGVVFLLSNCVLALDLYPPSWRGEPGTTYQHWCFDVEQNPALPEMVDNDYGTPTATVHLPNPWTVFWLPEHHGHQGVWKVSEFVEIFIPNTPPNMAKDIRIQMTYSDGTATDDPWLRYQVPGGPILTAAPPVHTELLPDGVYELSIWEIHIEPNPPEETIVILPPFCELYIDEIVIDTRCIPEPGTVCLLGLGVLAFLRKRRT